MFPAKTKLLIRTSFYTRLGVCVPHKIDPRSSEITHATGMHLVLSLCYHNKHFTLHTGTVDDCMAWWLHGVKWWAWREGTREHSDDPAVCWWSIVRVLSVSILVSVVCIYIRDHFPQCRVCVYICRSLSTFTFIILYFSYLCTRHTCATHTYHTSTLTTTHNATIQEHLIWAHTLGKSI